MQRVIRRNEKPLAATAFVGKSPVQSCLNVTGKLSKASRKQNPYLPWVSCLQALLPVTYIYSTTNLYGMAVVHYVNVLFAKWH